MTKYFKDKELAKSPPVKRAAYSDRTAWILAEISRLVYDKLPVEVSVDSLMAKIENAVEKGETKNVLKGLIENYLTNGGDIKSEVENELSNAGFTYLNSYAKNGTEALLCKIDMKSKHDGMLIVAFRGTQPTIKDIFTDLKASLVDARGFGRIHEGFNDAYAEISEQIEADLQQYPDMPVYMTGHSLGGALALVATRYLCSDSLGATYTFGAPRIADHEFFKDIKTPVYRIVNAADAVPRIPFGNGFNLFTRLLRLIPVNGTKVVVEWLERKFMGYTHYGYMIFLDAPPNVEGEDGLGYKDLKLIKSPTIFIIAPVVLKRYLSTKFKAGATDHKMDDYCEKLYVYAKRRSRKN